jgi:hypothetical protein
MSYRTLISVVAAAAIVATSISTEAFAYRGRVGVYHGGVHRGAVYRGGYHRYGYRGGYYTGRAAAVGAAAVGAAVAAPRCGYAPYPPCY